MQVQVQVQVQVKVCGARRCDTPLLGLGLGKAPGTFFWMWPCHASSRRRGGVGGVWMDRQEHGPGRVNPAWKCEGGVHHRLSCLPAYRTYCRLIKEKVQGMGPGKARPTLDLSTPSSLRFHPPVKGLPRHSMLGCFPLCLLSTALGIFNIQPLPPHLPTCSPSISNKFFTRFTFK